MISDIRPVLKKLDLKNSGHYDDQFYIIDIKDSNEYAKYYTKLDNAAVNLENPSFGTSKANLTTNVINYFELEDSGIEYELFLVADFITDTYSLKIKEK